MPQRPQVVVIHSPQRSPTKFCGHLQDRGLSAATLELHNAADHRDWSRTDAAVVMLGSSAGDGAPLESPAVGMLLSLLSEKRVATLVWGWPRGRPLPSAGSAERVSADASDDEVLGRVSTLVRYGPLVTRLDDELAHLKRLSRQLNRYFGEIDSEMRLAGRLQRDFLPRECPPFGPWRFARAYRPATWVSGDMYDVFRIDERHVGLFIADAMGHGTAAALMTMFLRQALAPKRITGNTYEIVTPAEAMQNLHNALARQNLPNFQFVTAAYAIIDVVEQELCVARGGHPYPIHVSRSGEIRELQPEGDLLGLADLEPHFDEVRVRCAPGDKIIIYSDGVENQFIVSRDRDDVGTQYTENFEQWSRYDAEGFIRAVEEFLDRQEGSLNPEDDVTILVAELTE